MSKISDSTDISRGGKSLHAWLQRKEFGIKITQLMYVPSGTLMLRQHQEHRAIIIYFFGLASCGKPTYFLIHMQEVMQRCHD